MYDTVKRRRQNSRSPQIQKFNIPYGRNNRIAQLMQNTRPSTSSGKTVSTSPLNSGQVKHQQISFQAKVKDFSEQPLTTKELPQHHAPQPIEHQPQPIEHEKELPLKVAQESDYESASSEFEIEKPPVPVQAPVVRKASFEQDDVTEEDQSVSSEPVVNIQPVP